MDLLQNLLNVLDNENVDIYIHIDKKSKEVIDLKTKKSKLFIFKKYKVNWAGYSQVRCELFLMKKALMTKNNYIYYHFISGSTFPLKSITYICDWFDEHYPKQFVGFDNENDCSNRVKYTYLFNEIGKPQTNFDFAKIRLRQKFISFQKRIKVNRFKRFKIIFKKGVAYFSITEDCARYILNNSHTIRRMLKHSISGDEVFVQTFVYNSQFVSQIYNFDDEYEGAKVACCWPKFIGSERKDTCFHLCDFNLLKNTSCFFAYKIEGDDALALTDKIKRELIDRSETVVR